MDATRVRRLQLPRGAVIAIVVLAAALVVALARGRPGREGPPLDPRSDGPLGTSALVTLLEELGAEVDLSPGLPDRGEGIALLLQDRLDEDQVGDVLDWVAAGGTLVVTDPNSRLTPLAIEPGFEMDTGPVERGGCTIDALRAIEDVAGGAAVRFEVTEGEDYCFSDAPGEAFVVADGLQEGQMVAVGGAAFVTNELLDDADNAVLAATLLAPRPGMTVRFVEPPIPAGGGDKTLGELVPGGVRRGLVQLAIAFVLYALWRTIRLGQPVAERQPVEVAGSELVSAIGRLLARTGAPAAAAETLRAELRRTLRTRLGIPFDVPVQTLAELTAARTGLEVDVILEAVDERRVTTDAQLVAVARAAASVYQEVPS